ncbi:hypothetical protein D1R32_gp317 [Tunisvirus fontaine2]|uniref:Uncharacterized protein n=1 Tax=Tunisvirus fontaine2 TaxID=1421067 RepID=V9SGL6_9VIRU|nr:hypothetical protein D1R32_gp317 [Tunisvirus fontaine2]AHC55034.1 hypothetical protein TNS_ORF316 [Tunisvirus fontaine2]
MKFRSSNTFGIKVSHDKNIYSNIFGYKVPYLTPSLPIRMPDTRISSGANGLVRRKIVPCRSCTAVNIINVANRDLDCRLWQPWTCQISTSFILRLHRASRKWLERPTDISWAYNSLRCSDTPVEIVPGSVM